MRTILTCQLYFNKAEKIKVSNHFIFNSYIIFHHRDKPEIYLYVTTIGFLELPLPQFPFIIKNAAMNIFLILVIPLGNISRNIAKNKKKLSSFLSENGIIDWLSLVIEPTHACRSLQKVDKSRTKQAKTTHNPRSLS